MYEKDLLVIMPGFSITCKPAKLAAIGSKKNSFTQWLGTYTSWKISGIGGSSLEYCHIRFKKIYGHHK